VSTSFNSWVNIDLRKSAAFDKYEEVDELVSEKLAKDIETQLRSRIDPGINRKSATAAEAIRVKAEGNRFVINSESHGDVLKATSKMAREPENKGLDAQSIEDLFEPSSGVPIAQKRPDGTTGLVYRRIELAKVFREQKQKAQEKTAEQAIVNAVTTNIGKRFEEAFDDVDRRNPEEK
jgi:hypothetical protein